MKHYLFYSLLICLLLGQEVAAQDYYYPVRPENITEATYNYYKKFLVQAYKENHYRKIGVFLANMGEKKEKVFAYFDLAIEENPSECYYFHQFNKSYKEDNFETTITKLSIRDWERVCNRCSTLMKVEEYERLYQEKIDAYQNKMKVDSACFDFDLIERLEVIYEKDQRHRGEFNKQLTDAQRKEFWRKQTILDKENLVAVEKIFEEYGYPGFDLVGTEHNGTPFIVIHHYPDIKIKEKYLPFLEEAVEEEKLSKADLKALKQRIERYYLNVKKDKSK